MRGRLRLVAVVGLVGLLIPCLSREARAAEPAVLGIAESRDAVTGRQVLTLVGKGFAAVKAVSLLIDESTTIGPTDLVYKSKSIIVMRMPPAEIKGDHIVRLFYGKALTQLDHPVTLGAGATWVPSGSDATYVGGRVGIGTATPQADLHVTGPDGVLFEGTFGQGTIPAEGAGTRMMWYPGKAAFRAGGVTATQWDDASVGNHSTATGFRTTASGSASTALGRLTTASGIASVATGTGSIASGDESTATGSGTTASGGSSTAMGSFTIASGGASTAIGDSTTAQAYGSLALGRYNVAGGTPTLIDATDPVLVVGNGTGSLSPSNAFTLLRNGNLTIAGTLTQNSDARAKTDVVPLAGVISKLATLHAVTYRFKEGTPAPEGRHIGLLAQEVRDAFPELVAEDSEGKLSVAYGNFAAVLLEAVKEQQATIDAQRKDLDAMAKRLEALEARLGAAAGR